MKKNILRRLAHMANVLDDLRCHKEAAALTAIMCRVAGADFGWDLPAGAANNPRAPYNQDDSGYEAACDNVDDEIKVEFVPALKEYYHRLIQILHQVLQSKNSTWNDAAAREQAIEDIFNVEPFYSEGEKAWTVFQHKSQNAFGKTGASIAEDAAEKFSEFAMQHHTPETFVQALTQIADTVIQPHYDGLCEEVYERMSDYEPDYEPDYGDY